MAGARQNVVTPPVPSKGGHTNGAAMGTSDGRARRVVEHSVYNWVELVYQAFGQTIPSDPRKVALLGVREETFSDGGGASAEQMTAKEVAAGDTTGGAVQGLHADARGTDRFDHDKKGNVLRSKAASKVTFNDMLYLVWTEQGAQHELRQHAGPLALEEPLQHLVGREDVAEVVVRQQVDDGLGLLQPLVSRVGSGGPGQRERAFRLGAVVAAARLGETLGGLAAADDAHNVVDALERERRGSY